MTSDIYIPSLSSIADCSPQPREDWTGDIPLPQALAKFYADNGPADVALPWIGNDIWLPSLKHLWQTQAGYRWHAITGALIEDWPNSWIVIAQMGGDPFVYDSTNGQILYAMAGAGSWSGAERVFDSLDSCISTLAALSHLRTQSDDFFDNDFNIAPQYLAAALRIVTQITGAAPQAEGILRRLSWG